jgi:D-serine deaminase-like pyridoxal phosphate-dependent protein
VSSPDTTAPPVTGPAAAPARAWERYEELFAELDAPFALVDLDAMWANADRMLSRARHKPIRVASKSVRCRRLLKAILDRDERFRGLLTFTLPETLWLHGEGFENLLLAYPTADRGALAELARLDSERPPVVMVDSSEQLDWIEAAVGEGRRRIRVCIELDVSWWAAGGRIKIGAKRSPVRTPDDAVALAREIVARSGFELAGLMGYEAHIAGVADHPLGRRLQGPAIRFVKRRSAREIAERRAAVVEAVREVAPLQLVNGGGTGSLHTTSQEEAVTEVTAGSGFYAPGLFDRYDFELTPAAMYAMPVVRRPSRGTATVLGGGYPASGAAGRDRLPQPYLPPGLRLDPLEGAGEVQTPVSGPPAGGLRVGDRVYFRHAKAGEMCERFDSLHLVAGGEIVDQVPTYRGEGRCFL